MKDLQTQHRMESWSLLRLLVVLVVAMVALRMLSGCAADVGSGTPLSPTATASPTQFPPVVATPVVATPVVATPVVATPVVATSVVATPVVATSTNSPTRTATATTTPSVTPRPTHTPTPLPPLVAIDAGHGGRDFGGRHFDADGHMDFSEKEANLAIVLKIAERVRVAGYRVLLTRDGDYRINSEQRLDLNEDGEVDSADEVLARTDLVNEADADLLLSIHQNAYYGADAQDVGGTQTLYCAERPFSDDSYRFACLVHEKLLVAFSQVGYETRDRGVMPDANLEVPGAKGDYLILLGPLTERISIPSQMPGVLSETLFVTNDVEAELLQRAHVQDALADAYAGAIAGYFQGQ